MEGLQEYMGRWIMAVTNGRRSKNSRNSRVHVAAEEQGFLLGHRVPFTGHALDQGDPVFLTDGDRSRHLLAVGGTGGGKSTLFDRLRDFDVVRGRTTVSVDPRGDNLDIALHRFATAGVAPANVSVIDMRQSDRVFPLNFLLGGTPIEAAAAVYNALYVEAESWGVQISQTLRASLTALAFARGSLLDVESLLSDSAYRRHVLTSVSDEPTLAFFAEYDSLSRERQRTWQLAISNKLYPFLFHPSLRLGLGASSLLDFGALINESGRTTLIALGIDRNPAADLVGRLIVSALQREIFARADHPQSGRNPVTLFLDEFPRIASPAFESLLSESRRFCVSLHLSHQFSAQLSTTLRHALRNNACLQLYFQTGALEAAELSPEIVARVPKEKVKECLLTLPVGQAILMRRGHKAVRVQLPDSPVPTVEQSTVDRFRETALNRLSIPRSEAEAHISRETPTPPATSLSRPTTRKEVTHVRMPRLPGKG